VPELRLEKRGGFGLPFFITMVTMLSKWFSDTSPESLEFYINLHRQMQPGQRFARVFEQCDFQQSLQLANIRTLYPLAGEREVFLRTAARRLGRDLMIKVYNWIRTFTPDRICGRLSTVTYGSRPSRDSLLSRWIGSKRHLRPTTQTNDIDVVADFSNADLQAFCRSLQAEFYLDNDNAERAVAMGRPFNAIHIKGAFKFDFFPAISSFTKVELSRKRYIVSSTPGLEKITFPVASPEDTVLAKLVWFQDGGEVSDRQWHDILGVLSVQSGRLDPDYLSQWASKLGVSDLLRRAFVDVGGKVDSGR
jgi:hypothetical protein